MHFISIKFVQQKMVCLQLQLLLPRFLAAHNLHNLQLKFGQFKFQQLKFRQFTFIYLFFLIVFYLFFTITVTPKT